MRLSDGTRHNRTGDWHCIKAALYIHTPVTQVAMRSDTRHDTILYAASAHGTCGLRRSNAGQCKAATLFLHDEGCHSWFDRALAQHAGIDDKTNIECPFNP
jgi:hypothetical protein